MFVSDSKIIINTQGIRYVHRWNASNGNFFLGVQYKGSNLNQGYESEAKRDEMFHILQNELVKGNK